MREIYFSTFRLGEKNDDGPTLEEVLPSIEHWCFGPRRDLDKPEEYAALSPEQSFNFESGTTLETQYHAGDEGRAYALRLRHPDTGIQGKRWMTEVVLSEFVEEETLRTRASIGLLTGFEGTVLTPDEEVISRPRLVRRLVDEHGAHETLPLQVDPRPMYLQDVDTFLDLLKYPDRNFPVVWMTARSSDEKYVVDPDPVADWLVGVAHVISSQNPDVPRAIGKTLPRSLNCFDGATRIYWPNFSTGDGRHRHQLWLPHEIEDIEQQREKGFREELLSTIADVTTNRIVDGVVRWSDVTKLRSRSQLESLRAQEDAALDLEFAEELFDTIDDLETRKGALQEKLDNVRDDLDKARGQVQYWKNQYLELASSNGEEKTRSPESFSPSSLSSAVETALERYGPSELEKAPSSEELQSGEVTLWVPKAVQRDVEDYFEDPVSAYGALEWIATTFHHAKTGQQSCSDFDKSCRGACGFSYSAHQSETTMGQYPEDYTMEWRGEKRMLRRHVGKGSDKDPRHTIRIAFFFDEELEVVVVGYIGQHQRTPAT